MTGRRHLAIGRHEALGIAVDVVLPDDEIPQSLGVRSGGIRSSCERRQCGANGIGGGLGQDRPAVVAQ